MDAKKIRDGALLLVAGALVAVVGCQGGPPEALEPSTVYVNGTVITVDSTDRMVDAFAVRGDKIVAVGTRSEVEALEGSGTQVVDLGGKTVVPGFYAPHDHFPGAGVAALYTVNLNSPPMGEMETIDDVVQALKAKAATVPDGAWVTGRGYDDTLLRDHRHPTRYDLDKASTTHPIWISHTSGHLGVGNSMALRLAGITRSTPQPAGGVIRKDRKTGEPDGVMEETATGLVSRLVPSLSEDDRMKTIAWSSDHYVSKGVTTTEIASGDVRGLIDLQKARGQGLLKLRIIRMFNGFNGSAESVMEKAGVLTGFGDDWLKIGPSGETVADGSIQGYTGYLTKPYYVPFNGDTTYRGYPRFPQAQLTEMVTRLHCEGYQMAIHGNGDASIDELLNAYAAAQAKCPRPDSRDRIDHAQMAREDQLERMKELGVTPSFFVDHVYFWGDRHRDIFMGPERAARISPLESAHKLGLRFTVHNDTPVTPVDPLHLIWTSVNRLTRSGKVLGPEERVTPDVALRSVTIDAAWQNFEEDTKGSLEPGKLADFVILSDNPLTVDPTTIKDIEVLTTVVGGRVVYENTAAGAK